MRTTLAAPLAIAVSSLIVLTACGSSDDDDAADDGTVSVVASTNVYGDIVGAIGGSDVRVTSIIDDPSADPHSFEASARTQLAVSKADLIVENGGGYDDFMQTLLTSTDSAATVIDAVDVSGKEAAAKAAGEELNEHVWYDFPTVLTLAGDIADELGRIDPDHADTYRSNGTAFSAKVQGLMDAEQAAEPTTAGAGVAITEPVPGYLLEALGADNRTPEEFSEAIEEGDDVSPAVLQQTLDLFTGGQVVALVYNEQTSGAETEKVLQAAKDNGVTVVGVTETLPEGEDYVSWMTDNLDAVVAALSR